ncbi:MULTISPECIES: sirohydrochlorin chelatase [Corynebacterium]|uniref:sirohydrochlorin chelatase n=1 Tax=Corynebacterium TaxID=1716 RepID=UPI0021A8FFCD|nr:MULTISPECIES: sirohydrochlorin chelatase [Corynebacterium]MCT1426937.1 sirohydrochlorin chelatase [Corynebacterium sp. p3-SID1241]MDV2432626.1 sirohydrochlorin chelatase [Corynebacterium tuberculostearicum]WKE56413.1 sirohydrochlorin chelatase [Corynebacterium tuberculostearicum]WKE59979.1 sirohydrochlorin chelatase [Corynebacterium tuberculostearicum]
MTALITLSHGSRKPGAAAGIERLTQATGVRPARAAHLEFNRPDLTTAALELAQLGETDAIVVPLLFTQGYHQRVDVPRALADASQAAHLSLHLTAGLGTGEDVARVLASRTRPGDSHVVIYSVGSSDTAANDAIRELAHRTFALTSVPTTVEFATRGGREGIVSFCREYSDPARVRVIPLFVTEGLLLDRLAGVSATVDRPLGTDLAGLVVDRFRQARNAAQEVFVPC